MDAGKHHGEEYPPKGTYTQEQLREARVRESAEIRKGRRAVRELDEKAKAAADPVRVRAREEILKDIRQRNPR